jgi:hypothetical protein
MAITPAEAEVPHAAFMRPGIPPGQTRGRLIMMADSRKVIRVVRDREITFALYAVGLYALLVLVVLTWFLSLW